MIKSIVQKILAAAARRAVRREKPRIVAITGSFGKSSTKEAIAVALGAREANSGLRASHKNYNNEYGVPFTILNVPAPKGRDLLAWVRVLGRAIWVGWGLGRVREHALVLEMGTDRKGDLAWLVGIAPPDIAVVTSVAAAHTEYIGTIDDVAKEKSTLVRALKPAGVAILNNDDPRVTAMRKDFEGEAIYVGDSEGSDVRVCGTSITVLESTDMIVPRGMAIEIEIHGKLHQVDLQGTIGKPQAWAVAAAFAVAEQFEIPIENVIDRLGRDYHGIPGRTRIIPGIKYTTIIDDSYNAVSPQTIISALRDVHAIPLRESQRRIAALGDMRELGEYSDEAHRSVGHEVAATGVDELVTCGTLARTIADSAIEAGMPAERIHTFDATEEGGRFLQSLICQGDIILVKGSQGSRMEKIVKELMAEPLEAPFLLVRQTKDWLD